MQALVDDMNAKVAEIKLGKETTTEARSRPFFIMFKWREKEREYLEDERGKIGREKSANFFLLFSFLLFFVSVNRIEPSPTHYFFSISFPSIGCMLM
jgi:hypothetical protein